MSDEKHKKQEAPYRRTVSFPKADESTAAWWEMQENPSISIRMLIRDEIERSGYQDYANRPVFQKPQPGRPPKNRAQQILQSNPPSDDHEAGEDDAEPIDATSAEPELPDDDDDDLLTLPNTEDDQTPTQRVRETDKL